MTDKLLLPQQLVAYLEHDLSPADAAEVEAQLADSPAARRQLQSYRKLTAALGAAAPELESLDLVSAVRRQVEQTNPPRPPVRARAGFVYAGVLAAAACAALVMGVANLGLHDEVRKKGVTTSAPDRWAGVALYRVVGTAAPTPLDQDHRDLGSGDGVLVSYTNLGPLPFAYLMVFAVDSQRQVTWLYPAWERASEDPTAIPVRKGVAEVELRSLIRPSWAVGPVAVHALFTHRPLGVHEVEALLAQAPGPLALAHSVEQIITLNVQPQP